MKALTSLLAVLLLLSSTSLAQTPQTPSPSPAPSPAASTPSAEADDASAATAPPASTAAPAVSLAPGAKIFLEPMNGFEQFLSEALAKKKVPVVVVKDRADADFVMSGSAHVKRPGFFTGMVMNSRGGGSISIKDARTGNEVFADKFHRVDEGLAAGYVYEIWAGNVAKHLKKAIEKKQIASPAPPPPPSPSESAKY